VEPIPWCAAVRRPQLSLMNFRYAELRQPLPFVVPRETQGASDGSVLKKLTGAGATAFSSPQWAEQTGRSRSSLESPGFRPGLLEPYAVMCSCDGSRIRIVIAFVCGS